MTDIYLISIKYYTIKYKNGTSKISQRYPITWHRDHNLQILLPFLFQIQISFPVSLRSLYRVRIRPGKLPLRTPARTGTNFRSQKFPQDFRRRGLPRRLR
jgi:hypothetical protein